MAEHPCASREAFAPGGIPFDLAFLFRGGGLPEGEVHGVALFGIGLHASTLLDPIHVSFAGELAVIRELRRVEIEPVFGDEVGEPFLFQRHSEVHHLPDIFGGRAEHFRLHTVQRLEIFKESLRIYFNHVPGAFSLAAGAGLHLVLAGIGVGGEVPHVGDVHHALDPVAQEFHRAHQAVLGYIGAHVPYMGVKVDCGAAGVDPGLAFFIGLKALSAW